MAEIRRIKARVDRERLPRGADPHTHLKLGRGGLADIEWTVQLLQLRYAGRVPALRSPRTLTALAAAREADLLSATRPRGPATGLALGQPAAQRDHAGHRPERRPGAARRPRAGGGRQHPRLRRRAVPTRWSTTTSAPPVAPAPSSTVSSGADPKWDFVAAEVGLWWSRWDLEIEVPLRGRQVPTSGPTSPTSAPTKSHFGGAYSDGDHRRPGQRAAGPAHRPDPAHPRQRVGRRQRPRRGARLPARRPSRPRATPSPRPTATRTASTSRAT